MVDVVIFSWAGPERGQDVIANFVIVARHKPADTLVIGSYCLILVFGGLTMTLIVELKAQQ